MRLRFLLILTAWLFASPTFAAPDPARFAEGVAAFDDGRYEDAYKIFVAIADEDVAATRNVAVMLRKGLGVRKDTHAAQLWFARAAKGGLFSAAADLGDMLLDGEADKPNPEEAFGWLAMAAQGGYAGAAYRLAGLYETGRGTKKNIEAARRLYAFAAQGHVPGAEEKLAALPPPPTKALAPVVITPAHASLTQPDLPAAEIVPVLPVPAEPTLEPVEITPIRFPPTGGPEPLKAPSL